VEKKTSRFLKVRARPRHKKKFSVGLEPNKLFTPNQKSKIKKNLKNKIRTGRSKTLKSLERKRPKTGRSFDVYI
jgi:hypothetical protein